MPSVESRDIGDGPPPRGATPIARLIGASVILDDRPVLRAIDLDLAPGITVLRGPNGSGKTTAFRTAMQLLPVTAGRILVDGADAASGTCGETGSRP